MVRFDVVMDEILDGLEDIKLKRAIEECNMQRDEESQEGRALLDNVDNAMMDVWAAVAPAHEMDLTDEYGYSLIDSWKGYWKNFPESAYVIRRLDAANAAYNQALEAYHNWQRRSMFNQACRNTWIDSLSV